MPATEDGERAGGGTGTAPRAARVAAHMRGLVSVHVWGDGKTVAADGSQIDTWENNLLAETIPCEVWEAVYIIEGLLRNGALAPSGRKSTLDQISTCHPVSARLCARTTRDWCVRDGRSSGAMPSGDCCGAGAAGDEQRGQREPAHGFVFDGGGGDEDR